MRAFEETMAKKSEVKAVMEKKVGELLRRTELENANSTSSSKGKDMEEKDYYSSICDADDYTELTQGQRHQRSIKSEAALIVNKWLQAKPTDSLSDLAFNNEKVLIDLFIRYNTAMPVSYTYLTLPTS